MNTRSAHPEHFFAAVEHSLVLLTAGSPPSLLSVMARGAAQRGFTDAASGYDHARLMFTFDTKPSAMTSAKPRAMTSVTEKTPTREDWERAERRAVRKPPACSYCGDPSHRVNKCPKLEEVKP